MRRLIAMFEMKTAGRILVMVALQCLAVGVARGDECEERCAQRKASCLATNANMRASHQYPSDSVCYDAFPACMSLCANARPKPSAESEQAQREAAEAHRRALLDSFKPPTNATPPTPEVANRRNACLAGDATACRQLHPAGGNDMDTDAQCRMRLHESLEICSTKASHCRADCEDKRDACYRATCDAVCSAHPDSLKCMLCACPNQIPCECDLCKGLVGMCPKVNEGQTQAR